MTCILSYNIQTGGTQRIDKLATIIKATQADVIGLIEATNPRGAEQLASELGMHLRLSGQARHEKDWHVGVLSCLPLVDVYMHARPGLLTKEHLLEVSVEEANGTSLTVFVVHLTADFHKRAESDRIRRAEVQEILRIMAARQGTPHLLMGDFNAIARGESFKVSQLLSYVMDPQQPYLKKYLDLAARSELDFITRSTIRLLKTIPHNTVLSTIADSTSPLYAPRAGLELLQEASYVDCYRHMNPAKPGFTYPAQSPACRIDFIFASPELALRLTKSYVIVKAVGVNGHKASDHLPVCAVFS